MRLPSVIMLIALVMATVSCSGRVDKEKEVLASLLGREIVIPDSLVCRILDTPIDYDMSDADYKIITYIDSAGCVPCRMKLPAWDNVINTFKSAGDVEVDFLMIINTTSKHNINNYIKQDIFLHPICIDSTGLFETLNLLSSGTNYQTVLVDINNKIVGVGNPVDNPKIRELYKDIITDNRHSTAKALCAKPVYALGVLSPNDTIIRKFMLTNSTERTITIQEFVPSCDCITATISSDSIGPSDSSVITVTLVADSTVGYMSRYVDVFYNENNAPERLMLHGYITNPNN